MYPVAVTVQSLRSLSTGTDERDARENSKLRVLYTYISEYTFWLLSKESTLDLVRKKYHI
ncbi:hypothetical protein C0J52_20364 [Blattella germanica]|nr:hypothetical protein C0J52_20364 [Blattella germanica]